ncbi:MAG: RNA polymerase sporulation sigma factor SigK [Bacilli bacterium]
MKIFSTIIEKMKQMLTGGLYFVGSSDKLPPPLSKEEEIRLVELCSNGDELAKEKLIEHNLRLVVYLSKKYNNIKMDLEDLVSIGSIGLIKAINTYKGDKNIKLATYASRCIDNEILMHLRKNKKRQGDISFEESLSFDGEGNELRLEDILGTDPDIVTKGIDEEVEKNLLYEEINNLNKRDKEIMTYRYGLFGTNALTQKEVSEKLDISQSYISRIEKKVIKKIQNLVKI